MLNEAIETMPEVFESSLLVRGHKYFEKGYVLHILLSDGLLKARIKGEEGQIYAVHIDLKTWPTQLARCTCASQVNCAHAAACLFALHAQEKKQAPTVSAHRLDKKLDNWLKNLQAQKTELAKPQAATHHLVYLVELKTDTYEHKVVIRLALTKLLKRGGYGRMTPFCTLSNSKKQHFIDNDDKLVALLLFKCGAAHWFDSLSIRDSDLLQRIIATGRAFFTQNEEQAIHLGEPIQGTCQWTLSANGNQNVFLMHEGTVLKPLLLDECWYFDHNEAKMGQISTPYPIKQLSYLLEAPPIPLEQAELLANKIAKTDANFPLPLVFKQREIRQVPPVAVLLLDAVHEFVENTSTLHRTVENQYTLFTVRIGFDYAGLRISTTDKSDSVVLQQEGILIHYMRDKDFETMKLLEVEEILQLRKPKIWEKEQWDTVKQADYILNDLHALSDLEFFYSQSVPELKNRGWQVEYLTPLHQEIIRADDIEWYSNLQEHTNDFFSYQLGILIENKPVNIVPLVADLIQHHSLVALEQLPDTHLVKLPLHDGRVLQLEVGRIKPLLRLLLQFGLHHIDEDQQLRINKYQFLLMREAELALAASQIRWKGAETLREQIRQLTQLTQIPEIPIPKGFTTQLRDYQHHGLNWLQFLRSCRFSGILADDMGLGKTVQTLAHLYYEKKQGRMQGATLIIAPTSLVGNWLSEAKRFTPELKILIYHGSERHQDHFDDYDLVISTYGLIHREKDKFISYHFYYLILDEAQFIKNSRTKTRHIIQQLIATHRLCLTGTPLENHLGELWSLFHFLMPGLLGDAKQFRLWFKTPIEKHADRERRELLIKRIQPFILRRTKNQVARELPPKTEMTRIVELIGPQRDLYEGIRMSMEKKVRDAIAKQGLGKSQILLLDALLKLRQVCCDPRLLSLPEATIAHGTSSKLEALMDLLDNLVGEGRRTLVFSQFTSMLQLIEKELTTRHYDYLKLTGQTIHRQAMVEQFQEGKIPIFLISLKAGGTGLNLTRADTVIHYDPWWNPAVEDQATDRTHRIGQENPVFVYKLITSGTVEEVMLSMQERKRQLIEGILSTDPAQAMALSEHDVAQFFRPL